MKVVIILCHNPYLNNSATANRWLTLIEGLANFQVEIKLFIYGGYHSELEAKLWNISGNINGISYSYVTPKLVHGYLKTRYHLYIGTILLKKKLMNALLKKLACHEGLIWTDTSYFCFQLAVKIKETLPGKKLFLEMSEFLDIHKYNKGNFLQKFQANQRQRYFESKAFAVYDGIALMTKTLLNHYSNFLYGHQSLLHLPMTVDLERFSQIEEETKEFIKPYIAFVGAMNDAKDGVNILISAFSQISLQFPDYKLYLIGPWNYDTPSHLQMIKRHGIVEKVFWMNEYERSKIPVIIRNASLLVLPRPDSKQAQGGFPTKLGEYLATGNPVCSTSVGEISDYLADEESVYFAEPGSVYSLAAAMHKALSNPVNAKRVGANGKKVAETYFNKEIQAMTLYNFLISLTNEKAFY